MLVSHTHTSTSIHASVEPFYLLLSSNPPPGPFEMVSLSSLYYSNRRFRFPQGANMLETLLSQGRK